MILAAFYISKYHEHHFWHNNCWDHEFSPSVLTLIERLINVKRSGKPDISIPAAVTASSKYWINGRNALFRTDVRSANICTAVFGSRYSDVIMRAMASQITDVSIVDSTVCWGADQIKQQRFASLAFVRGIHRWPVNFPHKGPVTGKMFPFDTVIMVKLFNAEMLLLIHHRQTPQISIQF